MLQELPYHSNNIWKYVQKVGQSFGMNSSSQVWLKGILLTSYPQFVFCFGSCSCPAVLPGSDLLTCPFSKLKKSITTKMLKSHTILCKNDRGQSVVKQLKRWLNLDY